MFVKNIMLGLYFTYISKYEYIKCGSLSKILLKIDGISF